MVELSQKRRQILNFIRGFAEEHGYPPTVRDIQNGCHISSTSVVDHHLRVLERDGLLRRDGKTSRGLELIGAPPLKNTILVPMAGNIAAGQPIPVPQPDAWDTVSGGETLELPAEIIRGRKNVYALRVKGQSMVDALINDGDIVLMQQVPAVDDGDMAAVWLKQEKAVTLKKLYRDKDRLRLEPANTLMKPIYVSPENTEVQGKVVAVIRTY
ncbi:MAG: repressor LexA [Chloroflexi bacterium]|nr:repressor LexA [Chloroflexota bacterium]